MAEWAAIEAELAARLEADGFELVQLDASVGRGARFVVLADKLDAPGTITLDECAELSRKISAWLDVEDPFRGPYHLLVSSPGLDRPLGKLAHCQRQLGRLVKVKHQRSGRPGTILARLVAVEGESLVLDRDSERLVVPWAEVLKAHVVYEWDDDGPPEPVKREKP